MSDPIYPGLAAIKMILGIYTILVYRVIFNQVACIVILLFDIIKISLAQQLSEIWLPKEREHTNVHDHDS